MKFNIAIVTLLLSLGAVASELPQNCNFQISETKEETKIISATAGVLSRKNAYQKATEMCRELGYNGTPDSLDGYFVPFVSNTTRVRCYREVLKTDEDHKIETCPQFSKYENELLRTGGINGSEADYLNALKKNISVTNFSEGLSLVVPRQKSTTGDGPL